MRNLITMSKKNLNTMLFALFAAIGILALGSCSSNDEIIEAQNKSNYPDDNIVRVEANVNDMMTRGSVKTSTLNNMSLTIHNAKNSKYCYNNIKVTKSGDIWKPEEMMLWENKDNSVNIIAYSPYKDGVRYSIIKTNTDQRSGIGYIGQFPVSVAEVQTEDNYDSDFLVYKKEDFNPGTQLSTRNAVPIAFKHANSQLVITVKFGTEFDNPTKLTANPITDLKVSGTVIDGYCNFSNETPTVSAKPDSHSPKIADVTPYTSKPFVQATGDNGREVTNAYQEYSCILIPQIVNANTFTVSFTLNGKTYKWTSPTDVTLEGGKKHTLEITVGKDYVVAGGMSATPWDTTAPEQNLNTD